MLRIRPPGARTDAEVYNPAHAWPNLFPGMLAALVNGLRRENWPPWVAEAAAGMRVTEGELAVAVDRFVAGCRIIAEEPDLTSPDDAFGRSGFQALRAPAKMIVLARAGQMATGSYWAVRRDAVDVPVVGVSPSYAMQKAVEASAAVLRSL